MKKIILLFLTALVSVSVAQTTPYIGLNLPPYAAGNWNVPVNQNFSILDSYLGGVTPFPNPLQASITGTAAGALPITGGTITGDLVVTGTFTCEGCAGVTFPGAGIPNSNGTDYLTSYSSTNPIPANFVSILNQNTTGTAANLTAPALLPNGTTAATQTLGDTSAALANDQFVSNTLASPPAYGSSTPATGTSQFTNIRAFGNSAANNFSVGSSIVLPSSLVGYHGTSGTKVQLSDGTGTPGFSAVFAADGSITNGSPASSGLDQWASTSCTLVSNFCVATVIWPIAFADTSYFVVCSATAFNTTTGNQTSFAITPKGTNTATIQVFNETGPFASPTQTFDCHGHHN